MQQALIAPLIAALLGPREARQEEIQKWFEGLSPDDRREVFELLRTGRGDAFRADYSGQLPAPTPDEEKRIWTSPLFELYLTRALLGLS
jgi:hypothetical protein